MYTEQLKLDVRKKYVLLGKVEVVFVCVCVGGGGGGYDCGTRDLLVVVALSYPLSSGFCPPFYLVGMTRPSRTRKKQG